MPLQDGYEPGMAVDRYSMGMLCRINEYDCEIRLNTLENFDECDIMIVE